MTIRWLTVSVVWLAAIVAATCYLAAPRPQRYVLVACAADQCLVFDSARGVLFSLRPAPPSGNPGGEKPRAVPETPL